MHGGEHAHHRARREIVAAHDGRIELELAVFGEARARAGVELRIILEHFNRAPHGVDRAAALREGSPRPR